MNRTSDKIRTGLAKYLRNLASRRNGTVSADDAHRFLTKNGVSERRVRERLSYINSTLREPTFSPAGETRSERPVARGRYITEWSLN